MGQARKNFRRDRPRQPGYLRHAIQVLRLSTRLSAHGIICDQCYAAGRIVCAGGKRLQRAIRAAERYEK